MKFPPLQLIDHTHFCLQGEVEIDPSAAIAPGVLFQADSDSRIVIGAGVCIGAGSVLHARHGLLIIEPGVSFGTGVLIVGAGRVGANACIGSSTTVLRPAIAPGEVVPPGSLLGDTSRQVTIDVPSVAAESDAPQSAYRSVNQSAASAQATQFSPQSSQNQQNGYQAASAATTHPSADSSTASQSANGQTAEERDRKNPAQDVDAKAETAQQSSGKGESPSSRAADADSPTPPSAVGVKVYGQGQIDQLLSALFPHRQPLNDDES